MFVFTSWDLKEKEKNTHCFKFNSPHPHLTVNLFNYINIYLYTVALNKTLGLIKIYSFPHTFKIDNPGNKQLYNTVQTETEKKGPFSNLGLNPLKRDT